MWLYIVCIMTHASLIINALFGENSMKHVVITTSVIILIVLSGCSKNPQSASGAYVSPIFYKDYSCDQVTLEMQRVASKVSEVSGVQRSKATNDAVVTGVGVVIFWPALFFLMDNDKEQELAQLKGELDALEQAAVQKNCHQLLDRIKRERDEVEETN